MAVLFGGPSIEHDVSLLSGEAVRQALDKTKYEVLPVLVSRAGRWSVEPEELKDQVDLIFNALKGEYGEDGTLQQFLRELNLPYVGSGVLPSALTLNKDLTAKLLRANGIQTPKSVLIEKWPVGEIELDFDLPAIVKPVNRGSSLGVSLVRREEELFPAIEKALNLSRQALIQEYLLGREIICLVLDDAIEAAIPLPLVEVVPGLRGFYDHYSKRQPGAVGLIAPAEVSREEGDLIQGIALAIHQMLDPSGILEIDFIKVEAGEPYVLEVNTVPSFADHGPLVQAAKAHGLTLAELLERMIEKAYAQSS